MFTINALINQDRTKPQLGAIEGTFFNRMRHVRWDTFAELWHTQKGTFALTVKSVSVCDLKEELCSVFTSKAWIDSHISSFCIAHPIDASGLYERGMRRPHLSFLPNPLHMALNNSFTQ